MAYEVVWTETAVADLEAIVAYIAEKNPAAAGRVGEKILANVEVLEQFPGIGPAYPPGSRGQNREISCKPYRIFYRVIEESERAEILTVWHASRRDPNLPP
jgi:plasmid stabilization system protein ParE